jgi:hypothetical protein
MALAVLDFIQEQLGGGAPELLAGLAHRRERDGRRGGEVDVVVADQGDVIGNADSLTGELLQQSECHQVVGAEDCGGTAARWHGGDRNAGLAASRDGQTAGLYDRETRGSRTTVLGYGSPCALVPFRDLAQGERSAEEGDTTVALL